MKIFRAGLLFRSMLRHFLMICALIYATNICAQKKVNEEIYPIGSSRQLFIDNILIEKVTGKADLLLHHPVPRNVVLETNEGWEGNGTNYITVFRDGDRYRMYYRAGHYSYIGGKDRPNRKDIYCYAESTDGIHWKKPVLGIINWAGSFKNNIILDSIGSHAFSPFLDRNPDCAPDAKYKALGWGGGKHGLYAFKSADGIHWALMNADPVVTKGAFDSQNLAFWDAEKKEYRCYVRDFRNKTEGSVSLINAGIDAGRDIRTAVSKDFIHWTEPEFVSYEANTDPGGSVPDKKTRSKDYPTGRVSELYTNQVLPYYRSPGLFIGFPTRYVDKGWTTSAKFLPRFDYRQIRAVGSRREGTAITEGMIMSSRDGDHFTIWPEAFLRPGLRKYDTWFYGDMYQNWGLVETPSDIEDAPAEISIYATEKTLQETGVSIRRYTIRIDGFVSLHAPLAGGELITKPFTFNGSKVHLNVSTSAAGSVKVEIRQPDGKVIPGFSLDDCEEIYGDDLDRQVIWKSGADLATLQGVPVRLRIAVKDGDVYSFVFN
ncbi:MAG: hypothetical protein J0H29_19885 [Sphingobacteriales bacterium]|nr:hypothetical protein [Sphingobacteriales bacterium]